MSTKVNLVPDENGNDPFVQISGTNIMQPIDIQSHLQTTIQTHNAVSVASNGETQDTIWRDCNGYDQISVTLLNDAATNNYITLYWSNDASGTHGSEVLIATSATLRKAGRTGVKARYLKAALGNTDTIAHTMSAWLYLTT